MDSESRLYIDFDQKLNKDSKILDPLAYNGQSFKNSDFFWGRCKTCMKVIIQTDSSQF